MIALVDLYDGLLLDLDGVLYLGRDAVPGAVSTVLEVASRGRRIGFVTNNASRDSVDIAEHIRSFGVACEPGQVVTSAQVAARWLAAHHPAGSRILVVGGDGLHKAVTDCGLTAVTAAADGPVAVVQGIGPDVGWRQLAEASYALFNGLPWVATNMDLTGPTANGIALGNGALVQALIVATGRTPDFVTGKPAPDVFVSASGQWHMEQPLVVGDRLDTDIAGAKAAQIPSLLVLTGVTGVEELLGALSNERPEYVGIDLSALLDPHPPLASHVGGWSADVSGESLTLSGQGSAIDAVRAATFTAWQSADQGMIFDSHQVTAHLRQLLGPRA